MGQEVFVVLFEFNAQYESSNSDVIGVATSMARAKALAETHFRNPELFYRASRHRVDDPTPLAWETDDAFASASLPWDDNYGYRIEAAPLED